MKSVSVEEIEQVQVDTFNEFMKLFPVLLHPPKPDDANAIKEYFAAKRDVEIHMVRIISHYRVFVDRMNRSNDFQEFSEELFMRQLQELNVKIANQIKERGNGDFNEQN